MLEILVKKVLVTEGLHATLLQTQICMKTSAREIGMDYTPCMKKVIYGGVQKLINKLKILISNTSDMHSPNGTL